MKASQSHREFDFECVAFKITCAHSGSSNFEFEI